MNMKNEKINKNKSWKFNKENIIIIFFFYIPLVSKSIGNIFISKEKVTEKNGFLFMWVLIVCIITILTTKCLKMNKFNCYKYLKGKVVIVLPKIFQALRFSQRKNNIFASFINFGSIAWVTWATTVKLLLSHCILQCLYSIFQHLLNKLQCNKKTM